MLGLCSRINIMIQIKIEIPHLYSPGTYFICLLIIGWGLTQGTGQTYLSTTPQDLLRLKSTSSVLAVNLDLHFLSWAALLALHKVMMLGAFWQLFDQIYANLGYFYYNSIFSNHDWFLTQPYCAQLMLNFFPWKWFVIAIDVLRAVPTMPCKLQS